MTRTPSSPEGGPGSPGSGSTGRGSTGAGSSGPVQPDVRQSAVDLLCDAFAEDRIPVEEFERRIDAVHAATTEAELRSLLADLPTPRPPTRRGHAWSGAARSESHPGVGVPARRPGVAADQVRDQSIVLGILGGGGRSGPWTPARTNWVMGILGGAEVDFREARIPPGVTEVKVFVLWGGAEIIVPPDVRVECSGVGILGGFEENHTTESTTDPDAPVLRVSGVAIMGGFQISVRHPGESANDARRRRKQERKERSRFRRGEEPD